MCGAYVGRTRTDCGNLAVLARADMLNHFRTLVVTAASAAVLAADADVCWDLPTDGTTSYYYC